MQKNNLALVIAALVVGGIIGYAGAGLQYSAQLDKVKKMFPAQPDIRSVSGTIAGISGNTITLKTVASINPFENSPDTREVTVTNGTKIIRSEPKTPEAFREEMSAYQKALKKTFPAPGATTTTAAKMPTSPMPFNEIAIQISDLKAGDMITVESGKDIKTAPDFEAVKITLGGTAAGGDTKVPGVADIAPSNPGTAPIVNTPPVRTDGGVPPTATVPK
ncbi:MAG: hypothetical protein WC835_03560 [Candidatus Paceibacterota bacterium]|jgi:hypothetical protein